MARTSAKAQPETPGMDPGLDPGDISGVDQQKRKPATRVRAGTLLAAVKDVAGVVSPKDKIPILANLHLQAGDGRILLTGTNLDVWATRTLASDDRAPGDAAWVQSIRPFTVTLPAKPLRDVLAEIDPDALVTLELVDPANVRPAGSMPGVSGILISAGRSRFKLPTLPADDYVLAAPFEVQAGFELPCSVLADALAAVDHAMSSEETRYYLNGVYLHTFQTEGEAQSLRFAATDGHRMARLALEVPEGGASFPAVIVHRETVALVARLAAEVDKAATKEKVGAQPVLIEADGSGQQPEGYWSGRLRFAFELPDGDEITVVAKSVDGQFPDYNRVIPADPAHWLMVTRGALAEAVKRVAVLASDKTRAVKLSLSKDRIELVVASPEHGEAREELPCSYDGPEQSLGFNSQYLRDALGKIAPNDSGDEVSLGLSDDKAGPVLIRAAGAADPDRDRLVQVLMPLRV